LRKSFSTNVCGNFAASRQNARCSKIFEVKLLYLRREICQEETVNRRKTIAFSSKAIVNSPNAIAFGSFTTVNERKAITF
jgi:hypothetical protein